MNVLKSLFSVPVYIYNSKQFIILYPRIDYIYGNKTTLAYQNLF